MFFSHLISFQSCFCVAVWRPKRKEYASVSVSELYKYCINDNFQQTLRWFASIHWKAKKIVFLTHFFCKAWSFLKRTIWFQINLFSACYKPRQLWESRDAVVASTICFRLVIKGRNVFCFRCMGHMLTKNIVNFEARSSSVWHSTARPFLLESGSSFFPIQSLKARITFNSERFFSSPHLFFTLLDSAMEINMQIFFIKTTTSSCLKLHVFWKV